jgi:peptide/nickel transport system permease protein
VFSWPGLGHLTIEAVSERDYPVLQGAFLLLAVAVVVANLIADLVYGWLDPRVTEA